MFAQVSKSVSLLYYPWLTTDLAKETNNFDYITARIPPLVPQGSHMPGTTLLPDVFRHIEAVPQRGV